MLAAGCWSVSCRHTCTAAETAGYSDPSVPWNGEHWVSPPCPPKWPSSQLQPSKDEGERREGGTRKGGREDRERKREEKRGEKEGLCLIHCVVTLPQKEKTPRTPQMIMVVLFLSIWD